MFRPSLWKRGQTYNQQPGFLPSGAEVQSDALTFCRTRGESDTDIYLTLTPHASKTRASRTFVDVQVITYNNVQSGSPCGEDNSNTYLEPPMPTLSAPKASMTSTVDYFSGSGQGNGASVIVLDTKLGAKALLKHYAQQLDMSGWRQQGVETGQPVQAVTYRFRSKGKTFVGTLQITSLAKERYLAQLTVVQLQP